MAKVHESWALSVKLVGARAHETLARARELLGLAMADGMESGAVPLELARLWFLPCASAAPRFPSPPPELTFHLLKGLCYRI